jgi:hypothetical protein
MKKLFISLLIIIFLGGGLVFTSIVITDYEKLYQEFIKSTRADASLVKVKNFKINKFPKVYLSIEELSQDGKLTLANVEIHFSLMSLLQFSPKITSLKIGEAKLFLNHDDVNIFSHDEFISELINKDALSVEAKIDKLTFVESDNDIPLEIIDFVFASVNDQVKFSGKINNLGKIEGDFVASGNDVKFSLYLEDDNSSSLKVVENYKDSIFQDGKVEIRTSSLASRIVKLIPDINQVKGGIDSSEIVEILFDLEPMNHWIGVKNIVISSDSIEGKGEINLSKKSEEQSDIKLSFSKIDLVNWRKSKDVSKVSEVAKYGVNSGFDFNKNRLKAQIFLKEVKLDENNIVRDINAKFSIERDKLTIENLSGDINKTGSFEVVGAVIQNSFRSLFNGRVYLNHKDLNDLAELLGGKEIRTSNQIPFSLSTDVKLSSVDISIQNLLIKTADTAVMGNISTKFIGDSKRINSNIKFTSVDADQGSFPGISQALSYAGSLTEGMKEENYLSKFIPIRKINSIGNYDITFDRLKAGNKLYENVNFNLSASPGKVSLEQLYIQDGTDWVDTSISLVAEGIKPMLAVKIHNGSIGVNFLSPSGMLNLRKKLLEEYDLGKIDISMNFALKKLYEKNFELGKIKFTAQNDRNLFNIDQFDADVFGGRLQSSGSILLDPYTLNFVYALNSAGVQEIAKLLPAGTINSGGLLSASGMWSTNGNRTDEQLYNLYTKSDILAKDITVSNISIDELIQLLGNPNYNIINFEADVKNSLLTGKTDISDLKTSVELSKGVFTMPSLVFKTLYSSGSGSAVFDLYKWSLDANGIFSFYLAQPKRGRSSVDYSANKMTIKAIGNVLSPKKEADTTELLEVLKSRNQK